MMLFWDASALAKRYIAEEGSDMVDLIFDQIPLADMATSPWGYVETYTILLRRHNAGAFTEIAFREGVTSLQAEVAQSELNFLSVNDEVVFNSIPVIYRHNLNATDAALLTLLLQTLPSPPPDDFFLVASDKRLIRAATTEGLKTLDPTAITDAEWKALLDKFAP